MMSTVTGSVCTRSTGVVLVSTRVAMSSAPGGGVRGGVGLGTGRGARAVVPVRVDDQRADGVDRGGVPGQDQRRGVHLGDDGRALDDVAGGQPSPVVEGRVDGPAVD